jgi:hypothetical protein
MFQSSPMIITVWDHDKFTEDDFLGCVCLQPLLLAEDEDIEQWYPLEKLNTTKYQKEQVSGQILLKVCCFVIST